MLTVAKRLISFQADIDLKNMANVPDSGQHHHPAISVVMPTFNDGEYLREAIDSILNQTFLDFEFIIINDGSTDDTEEIISSYKDDRIRYLKNDSNLGNTITRNKGMDLAKGKYIAIMDSDDISVPGRLALQFEYLEKHPEIGILGGSKIFFDDHSWFYRHYPTKPEYIKSFLFFKNPVGQPTVMLRREIITEHELYYNPEYENGEDFDFWYRAALKDVRIANLKDVLLYYRQSKSQMSHPSNSVVTIETLKTYFRDKLDLFDIKLSDEEFVLLHNFIRGRVDVSAQQYQLVDSLLIGIFDANIQKKIFDTTAFRSVIFANRIRLLKYAYLEKGKLFPFIRTGFYLLGETGFRSLWQFWINEGKYGRSFGASKTYSSVLPFQADNT